MRRFLLSNLPFYEQSKGYDLAKEMLELALRTVRSEAAEEWKHAMDAQTKWKKAFDQEKDLEKAAEQARDEALNADDKIEFFASRYLSNLDKWQLHRQETALEIAHRVEDYVERRLREVRAKEYEAREEEDRAEEHLLELSTQEKELQALLHELKKAKNETTKKNGEYYLQA